MCYTGDSFIAELSNPHKILEYLSTGKAVISHYIDEYKNKTALIEMATYNEEIPGIFDKVINNLEKYNHPDLQIARKEFARKNTYTIKLEQIEKIVRSL